jgi:hypothetical protein
LSCTGEKRGLLACGEPDRDGDVAVSGTNSTAALAPAGGLRYNCGMWLWLTCAYAANLPSWATLPPPIPITLPLQSALPKCGAGYGAHLPTLVDAPGIYRRSDDSVSHGSPLLLEAIGTVARHMRALWPEADPLVVGRLNQPGGKRNEHLMHQDGLDADIGIYTGHGKQQSFGVQATPATLDAEKTWDLVRSFLSTDKVQWILLDQTLIDTLAHWTVAHGELDAVSAERTFPRRGGWISFEVGATVIHVDGHKNHIHVHMKCDD